MPHSCCIGRGDKLLPYRGLHSAEVTDGCIGSPQGKEVTNGYMNPAIRGPHNEVCRTPAISGTPKAER